ncbi:protein ROOT HAIR SPECIFIC 17-like isoform X1 [Andrographis paniculata]|uniref:protein ROOT HAIR SPECIFIC 17-like isoform X1 n=1 Tax=Andrographis paniculata TaxID=175694 RepID=UPI0021E89F7F|nr:protein ROOT HAIR SPECIFIC 17-like isoform X1 [Andrographis paniculata]XP_051135425.1 protein ROOT HAIR SPECIFIC 17-like isoform X1 [Andrographis paniculata]XP_051135429.1 protein ROOT HAIR SPECIFIC 17-like isoform X1 [Andrographis paniculata]
MAARKKWHRDDDDDDDGELLGFQILHCLIFRHHHHYHHPQSRCRRSRRRSLLRLHGYLLPLLFALSASFLILFAILLFFAPSVSIPIPLNRSVTAATHGMEAGMIVENNRYAFRIPTTTTSGRRLWSTFSNSSSSFHGCSDASSDFSKRRMNTEESNRFLLIATSGGLNQQRIGIVDAVVAAYILNATLVVPKLDQKSFWKDDSNFSDIFNLDWFISSLSTDVKIVQQLPEKARKFTTTRPPRKCNQTCYETRILPLYHKKRVQTLHLTKFDYRLSNRLDEDLQKLRCRANYHALHFTDPIVQMATKLVERMRMKSNHFLALHLRFEPDMLAFTGCYYGGGSREIEELGKLRKRWKTLHKKNPERERRRGKCPLSPEEAGLMLRALGYSNDVHIYVASGEVYGGEETLAPLRALFPNLHSKDTLASKEELAPFAAFSSRMAALDFIVCDESDVFVTNNNGNMAKILAGKRRYFGHKPTIRPNAKKLQRLFPDREKMTWQEFALQVETAQIGFMGEPNEVKPGTGVFYEHPLSCICQQNSIVDPSHDHEVDSTPQTSSNDSTTLGGWDWEHDGDSDNDSNEVGYEGMSEEEQELFDAENALEDRDRDDNGSTYTQHTYAHSFGVGLVWSVALIEYSWVL